MLAKPSCSRLAYITHDDIRRIGCFSEDTLLAVKAPFGSTLEVPDPDEGMPPGRRRYEIQLTSRTGPIDVFLIQDTPLTTPHRSAVEGAAPSAQQPPNSALTSTADINESALLVAADEALLKNFNLPSDPYTFELKNNEGISDLYGFTDMFGPAFAADAAPGDVKLARQ